LGYISAPWLCWGGIGPYEYKFLGLMLRKAVRRCQLITVRDQPSYDLLRKVGVKQDIKITADASQVLMSRDLIYDTKESKEIRTKFEGKKKIFVFCTSAFDWSLKVREALENYVNNEDYAFVVGCDQRFNRKELIDFAALFPKDRVYTFFYNSPHQLLSIYSVIDTVITPKLHTGIVGCTMGKSVICFSIQYAKTRLYYEKIGYSERAYDFFNLSIADMGRIIEKYIDVKVKLPEEIVELAESNYDLLNDFLTKYVKESNPTV